MKEKKTEKDRGQLLFKMVPPSHQISIWLSLFMIITGTIIFFFSITIGFLVLFAGAIYSISIILSRTHVIFVYENGIRTGFFRTYQDPYKKAFIRMWGEGFKFVEYRDIEKIIPITWHTLAEELSGIRIITTGKKSFGDKNPHLIITDMIRFRSNTDLHTIMNIMQECMKGRWYDVFERNYRIDSKDRSK